MLSIYKIIFNNDIKKYPDNYSEIIRLRITNLIDFYKSYSNLATIEIFEIYKQFEKDEYMIERLNDVYELLNMKEWKNLTCREYDYLKKRYLQELNFLGKEFHCAI